MFICVCVVDENYLCILMSITYTFCSAWLQGQPLQHGNVTYFGQCTAGKANKTLSHIVPYLVDIYVPHYYFLWFVASSVSFVSSKCISAGGRMLNMLLITHQRGATYNLLFTTTNKTLLYLRLHALYTKFCGNLQFYFLCVG